MDWLFLLYFWAFLVHVNAEFKIEVTNVPTINSTRLSLSSSKNSFIYGFKEGIQVHTIKKNKPIYQLAFPKNFSVEKYNDFKLINENVIAFCVDLSKCVIIEFNEKNTLAHMQNFTREKMNNLSISFFNKSQQIFIHEIFKNRSVSVYSSYKLNEHGNFLRNGTLEEKNLKDIKHFESFSDQDYTFFISKVTRIYGHFNQNLAISQITRKYVTNYRITRICNQDGSDHLYSKSDFQYVCDDPEIEVNKAFYNSTDEVLYFYNEGTSSIGCAIQKKNIIKRFDEDWAACQESNFDQVLKSCEQEPLITVNKTSGICSIVSKDGSNDKTCYSDVPKVVDYKNAFCMNPNKANYAQIESFAALPADPDVFKLLQKINFTPTNQNESKNWLYTILGVAIILFLFLLILFCISYKKKRSLKRNDRKSDNAEELSQLKENVYMNIKPSNALDKIKPAKFRIRPNRIIIKEKNNLGNGHYSTIYEGSYNTDNKQTWIKVACKVMNSKEEKSLQDQIMEVHRDIEVLKNLVHINIVKFYGVTFNQTNDYGYVFIIEFSDVGDMEKYFINARNRILVKEAKQWIMEVINGLTFLHKNNTIHRDLSAKNVLLFKEGSRKIAKLTDFGLSRRLNEDQYYHASSKTEVPINRITLNAMQTLKFSVYDDIWALGTLIYELFHINRIMYSDIANDDNYVENFRKHLKEGNRLIFTYERKNENYDKLFSIAESCWHDNRSERPTLSEILDRLKALNFGDDILEHLSQ